VLGIVLLLQAGQVSFGHAMFFATGAYAAAFWGKFVGGGDILLYLLLGGVSSTIFGLIVGLFVVRYREIFFGMLNMAFSDGAVVAAGGRCSTTPTAPTASASPAPACWDSSFTPETFQYVILYVSLAIAIALSSACSAISKPARAHAAGASSRTRRGSNIWACRPALCC
jgi:branched-chain amino acid transport system permease protein